MLKPRGYLSSDADIELRIVFALTRLEKPAGVTAISEGSGVGKQLVSYHLPQLVRKGLVLKVSGTEYVAQATLKDEKLLERMTPFIVAVAKSADISQGSNPEETVFNLCRFYLLFHTLEL